MIKATEIQRRALCDAKMHHGQTRGRKNTSNM